MKFISRISRIHHKTRTVPSFFMVVFVFLLSCLITDTTLFFFPKSYHISSLFAHDEFWDSSKKIAIERHK